MLCRRCHVLMPATSQWSWARRAVFASPGRIAAAMRACSFQQRRWKALVEHASRSSHLTGSASPSAKATPAQLGEASLVLDKHFPIFGGTDIPCLVLGRDAEPLPRFGEDFQKAVIQLQGIDRSRRHLQRAQIVSMLVEHLQGCPLDRVPHVTVVMGVHGSFLSRLKHEVPDDYLVVLEDLLTSHASHFCLL